MLVLSRHIHEVIRIGDNIKIVIVDIRSGRGGKVRVGIEAPKELEVHREEVYQAIQRDKIQPSVIDALVAHVTAPDAQKETR